VREGALLRDDMPCLYINRLTLGEHSQTGVICCSSIDDYTANRIRKHEHTRAEKEIENVTHIEKTHLHSNPVFLTYKPVASIDEFIRQCTAAAPDYQLISDMGVKNELWILSDEERQQQLTDLFQQVPVSYIADGHHRAAAAAIYAKQVSARQMIEEKSRDYNYFLTSYFPSTQLRIYDYNRVVKDLNGLSEEEFFRSIKEKFTWKPASRSPYNPSRPHRFGMCLANKWYKLKAREGTWNNDPLGVLDVGILQNNLLSPILGIHDPRTDKRIEFLDGVKGLEELDKKVRKGKWAVAFSLYPVSMEQLFAVSDTGEVMPPKSTWFEPKLLSGLVIFKMEF
jgi:uncharacterized protein (DUF1015 family)